MTARRTFNEAVPRARLLLAIGTLVLVSASALPWPRGGQAASPHSVVFTLVAGKTSGNGGFNFNGYAKGALTVTVPVGWRVAVRYSNAGALRHSLDVVSYTGTQPDSAPPPAFPGASTKDLVDGIGVGKQETVTFAASKAGTYELLCGVLGHAQAGMWARLTVSPTAKAPSVRPARGVVFTTQ